MLTFCYQVSEWNLVNEGGSLKLSRSWKVKSFNKGLEFFRIVADLAEAQGIFLFFFNSFIYLGMRNYY
jgi:4a-hydroxytetrahydrobiopterin dehydratase